MNVLLLVRLELREYIAEGCMKSAKRNIHGIVGPSARLVLLCRILIRVDELYERGAYLTLVLAAFVELGSRFETAKRWYEIRRGEQALQDGVHEASIVLAIT